MKKAIIVLLTTLSLISVIAIYAFTKDVLNYTDDYDKMPASEKHEILAAMKAGQLETARAYAKAASETASIYDQTEYDVRFYDLNFVVDADSETFAGVVTIWATATVDGLDTLEIDLDTVLTVDSVYYSGGLLNYEHSDNKIFLELDKTYNTGEVFSFTVDYNGVPAGSGLQGFSFDVNTYGDKVISTLSEPFAARSWWPCKDRPDDKADSVNISVTVQEPYYCASNGTLVDTVINGDGTWTFDYEVRYPITSYLVSLAISNYTVWNDWYYYGDNDSMEIIQHVYPDRYTYSLSKWSVTPNVLSVLAGLFGEYPFVNEKYGHANFEWSGGMEHQTMTSMSAANFGFALDIVVHEASHQWWGDMITCENWHHIWLNEGFASYCEALYREVEFGPENFHEYMTTMFYPYGGTIYVEDTTDAWGIFSSRVYDKGAWVLHMLRHVVGDSLFFAGMRNYYNSSHQYGHANTEDFQAIMENTSGMDLDYFFQQWIYGTYYPEFLWAEYIEYDPANDDYYNYFHLRQGQTTDPDVFEMPVDIVFYNGSTLDTQVVFFDVKDTIYIFKTDYEADSVVLDPNNWIMSEKTHQSWGYKLIPFGLDTAYEGEAYFDSVVVKGVSSGDLFTITLGALPAGLELDSLTGFITGIPTELGTFNFEVTADDIGSLVFDKQAYQLVVSEYVGLAGDANNDGTVNLLDITFLINRLYLGGVAPVYPEQADPNGDCSINLLDITYLIEFLYQSGPDPIWGCAE